jgi:hypothetical protein
VVEKSGAFLFDLAPDYSIRAVRGGQRRWTAGRRGSAAHESSAGTLHVVALLAGAAPAVDLHAGRNGGDAGGRAEHVLVREAERTVRGEVSEACG